MGEGYTHGGGAAMSMRTRWARWQWALGSVAEGAPADEIKAPDQHLADENKIVPTRCADSGAPAPRA